MVSAMDEAVENITKTYKQLGLWDDTIMVFTTGKQFYTLTFISSL